MLLILSSPHLVLELYKTTCFLSNILITSPCFGALQNHVFLILHSHHFTLFWSFTKPRVSYLTFSSPHLVLELYKTTCFLSYILITSPCFGALQNHVFLILHSHYLTLFWSFTKPRVSYLTFSSPHLVLELYKITCFLSYILITSPCFRALQNHVFLILHSHHLTLFWSFTKPRVSYLTFSSPHLVLELYKTTCFLSYILITSPCFGALQNHVFLILHSHHLTLFWSFTNPRVSYLTFSSPHLVLELYKTMCFLYYILIISPCFGALQNHVFLILHSHNLTLFWSFTKPRVSYLTFSSPHLVLELYKTTCFLSYILITSPCFGALQNHVFLILHSHHLTLFWSLTKPRVSYLTFSSPHLVLELYKTTCFLSYILITSPCFGAWSTRWFGVAGFPALFSVSAGSRCAPPLSCVGGPDTACVGRLFLGPGYIVEAAQ